MQLVLLSRPLPNGTPQQCPSALISWLNVLPSCGILRWTCSSGKSSAMASLWGCALSKRRTLLTHPPPFPHLSTPLDKIADEAQAKAFLSEYNSTAEAVWNTYTEASWAYNTNITNHNKEIMVWEQSWGCVGRGNSQGRQLVPRACFS